MNKLIIFTFLSLFNISLYAQSNFPNNIEIMNKSARVNVNNEVDFFTTASFIAWKAQEENLNLVEKVSSDATENNRESVSMGFSYQPGFQVGIGVHFTQNDWTLMSEYTSIYFKNSKSASQNRLLSQWYGTSTVVTEFSATWKVDYDMLDLLLQKPVYITDKFIFTSAIGIQAGSIDQRLTGQLYSLTWHRINYLYSSDSWLLGPMIYLGNNWLLGNNFRLFGNTKLSIFYQKFPKLFTETSIPSGNAGASTESHEKDNDVKTINYSMAMSLGVSWGRYNQCKNLHYDFSFAYNLLYYWNQNRIRQITTKGDSGNTIFTGLFSIGDLMLHGFTLKAQIDF